MSVSVEKSNLNLNPKCSHGPTILFSRNGKEFFACSACRDRKECEFFLWKHRLSESTEKDKAVWEDKRKEFIKGVNRQRLLWVFNEMKDLDETKRVYCRSCEKFVLPKYVGKHKKHDSLKGISDDLLRRPSCMLKPLDDNKKEAQYFFSENSIKVILNIVENLNIRNVLNIGTPRIHEDILIKKLPIKSLLLDFDKRFVSFYKPEEFCWYNMFNHHFFLPKSRTILSQFLKQSLGNLILITDPPFGGRIELLSKTFKRIEKLLQKLTETKNPLKIFLISPYFMEPQITNHLPNFKILDYKVDYENHILFQKGHKGRKQGSPVRIFTNVELSSIILPPEDGYKYCSDCDKWVAVENKHCHICKECTSRDGRTYVHCDECQRCVKPTWKHCKECNRCAQINHECGDIGFWKKCFHCHREGHKKRECPLVDKELLRKKRRVTH